MHPPTNEPIGNPSAGGNDADGDHTTTDTPTPQIEAILDDLADLCCEGMSDGQVFDTDRAKQLVTSLSTNGWLRHNQDGPPLSTVIEKRTIARCQEPSMHRGGALENLTRQIQEMYDDISHYSQSAPDDEERTQAQSPRTGVRGD